MERSGPVEIVLVEDDRDALELLENALVRSGFHVRAFSSADEAAGEIQRQMPDVVVSDLVMATGMSGLELATMLRGEEATRELPVIAVTGLLDPEWSVVRPFDAYVRKPVNLELLAQLVRTFASRSTRRARPLATPDDASG